ncbi:MAG: di-trans,poly-cis-decaprenylcistransferase [Chloroflexi bacterium]|nr:di-trans,poly-cis-decaprenylcistransferase [Chloroflexota bacterium]
MTRAATTRKLTLLPSHVAIVPDGNGRWAERYKLPRVAGHRAGIENMHRLLGYINEYPIKYLTFYGFSTENWGRPEDEVEGLFELTEEFIARYVREIHEQGIRLRHLGRLNELPPKLQRVINDAIDLTRDNTAMTLSFAFNYGGRAEIVDAARRIVTEGVEPQKIDEKLFECYLYTAGLPNVDLLIRTGDELRLSNFLIWQTAYSEYYFTKVLWPDFSRRDLDKALLSYSQRQRRFGRLRPESQRKT